MCFQFTLNFGSGAGSRLGFLFNSIVPRPMVVLIAPRFRSFMRVEQDHTRYLGIHDPEPAHKNMFHTCAPTQVADNIRCSLLDMCPEASAIYGCPSGRPSATACTFRAGCALRSSLWPSVHDECGTQPPLHFWLAHSHHRPGCATQSLVLCLGVATLAFAWPFRPYT